MGKTLVVYYSAQGHTKNIAEKVASYLGVDTYEIVPAEKYSESDLDWTDDNSRASREFADASLRDVELSSVDVPGWDEYDTIVIGYPIWWGIAAWPTNSFVKQVDLNGKKVIPFCTSHTSGVGESDLMLKKDADGGEWAPCHRFFQDAGDESIKSWVEGLKD